jgi:hypothetical protein
MHVLYSAKWNRKHLDWPQQAWMTTNEVGDCTG